MKNNKIGMVIVLVLTIISVTLIGLGIYISTTSKKIPPITEEPPKVAKKAIVDGHMTNIEETIRAQVTYESYRFKSLGISEQGPYYVVEFYVDNMTDKPLEPTTFSFTFLDSNKKQLTEIKIQIPELNAGETKVVESLGGSEKIYDAFYYKVSKEKTTK